jgi:hypothetical protein
MIVIGTFGSGCGHRQHETTFLNSLNIPALTMELLSPGETNVIAKMQKFKNGGASGHSGVEGIVKEWNIQQAFQGDQNQKQRFISAMKEKIEAGIKTSGLDIIGRGAGDSSFSFTYRSGGKVGDLSVYVVPQEDKMLRIIVLVHEN